MNLTASGALKAEDSIVTLKAVTELSAFKAPQTAAAVLQRPMPVDVARWIEALDPQVLPRGRVILSPNAVPDAVQHLCDMSNLPSGPQRAWLQEDIISWAEHFAALMEAPLLRMRLDVVTNNACRKFHIDHIVARLICTYRGTGTQYGLTVDGDDPTHIHTTEAGSPILLRGTLWPEEPSVGLRHRSPPIEGTGETRLVLVLDPIFDPVGEV